MVANVAINLKNMFLCVKDLCFSNIPSKSDLY